MKHKTKNNKNCLLFYFLTIKINFVMKKLDLEQMGVQEMNAMEMMETDGGWVLAAIAIFMFAGYLYNEGGDFTDGVSNGFNETFN